MIFGLLKGLPKIPFIKVAKLYQQKASPVQGEVAFSQENDGRVVSLFYIRLEATLQSVYRLTAPLAQGSLSFYALIR